MSASSGMSAEGASIASLAPSGSSSAETSISSMLMPCGVVGLLRLAVLALVLLLVVLAGIVLVSSSESRARSSPMSSESSRSCTTSPKRRWSLDQPSPAGRARVPARSSMNGRHRSTSLRAAGGGCCAGQPLAHHQGDSVLDRRVGAVGDRRRTCRGGTCRRASRRGCCATPCMRRAPIASTRACSTASNTARACWPPGICRRCTAGSWQASRSAMAVGVPAHDRGVLRGQLARRLGQPRLAARHAGPLGRDR